MSECSHNNLISLIDSYLIALTPGLLIRPFFSFFLYFFLALYDFQPLSY